MAVKEMPGPWYSDTQQALWWHTQGLQQRQQRADKAGQALHKPDLFAQPKGLLSLVNNGGPAPGVHGSIFLPLLPYFS